MTPRPTFVARRSARLAARLQLIAWTWRFARAAGGRVVALWPPLPARVAELDGPDYNPAAIFDLPRFYAAGGGDELIFLEGRVAAAPADSVAALADADGVVAADALAVPRPPFLETLPPTVRAEGEPGDPAHLFVSLRATWSDLPHHPAVVRGVALARERIGDDYVAVHVRRGDVVASLTAELPLPDLTDDRLRSLMTAYVTRCAPVPAYDDAMGEALATRRRVVLFTDTPEMIGRFRQRYGAAAIVDGTRGSGGRLPIQKAFVDFNLLVGARAIVGTSSIYAGFAASLGAARLANVVAQVDPDRLLAHLLDGHLAGAVLPGGRRCAIEEAFAGAWRANGAGVPPGLRHPPLPRK